MGASLLAAGRRAIGQQPRPPANTAPPPSDSVLPMERYQPKSMLHVPETHVPRSRFPLIDFHTHITHATRRRQCGRRPLQHGSGELPRRHGPQEHSDHGECDRRLRRRSARSRRQTANRAPRPLHRLHRTGMDQGLRRRVCQVPGRPDRRRTQGRRERPEGAKNPRPLPARARKPTSSSASTIRASTPCGRPWGR